MEDKIKFSAEKVLKRETNQFLKEIEKLIETDGVGKLLVDDDSNKQQQGKEKGKTKSLKVGQFRILMDAAEEAACIEELLLFLSYQKARGLGWEIACGNSKEDVAKKLADSFMNVQKEIFGIMKQEDWAKDMEEDDERLLRLMIAKKYLGYLYWKAYAVSK